MKENELLDLRDTINDAKIKVSKLEGRLEQLLSELKDKWSSSTLNDARDKLNEFNSKIEKLQNKINIGLNELEIKYNEIDD